MKCKHCDGDEIVEVTSRTKPDFFMPCPSCSHIPGIEPIKMSKKRLKEISKKNYRDMGMTLNLLRHICYLHIQLKISERKLGNKAELGKDKSSCWEDAKGAPRDRTAT